MKRRLALALIRAYQRWLSPRKGYACAYRVGTGGASCSTLGYRAVRRHGVRGGLIVLRARMRRCGEVQRTPLARRPRGNGDGGAVRYRPVGQRGDCDLGGGDSSCNAGDGCEALACGDCDFGSRRRRNRDERVRTQVCGC